MKKILALILLLPTLSMATDYKALYLEAESRLNELQTRLNTAREKNVELYNASQAIDGLSKKVAKYNNYVLIHNLVPDGFRSEFEKYYGVMFDYISEWETYKTIDIEHRYNSANFLVLKDYVKDNLNEVTFDRHNVVYVNGERLVE